MASSLRENNKTMPLLDLDWLHFPSPSLGIPNFHYFPQAPKPTRDIFILTRWSYLLRYQQNLGKIWAISLTAARFPASLPLL